VGNSFLKKETGSRLPEPKKRKAAKSPGSQATTRFSSRLRTQTTRLFAFLRIIPEPAMNASSSDAPRFDRLTATRVQREPASMSSGISKRYGSGETAVDALKGVDMHSTR
jgi:hypothetical protein